MLKRVLAGFLASATGFLATLKAPLAVIFSPSEVSKAFTAGLATSSALGFAVAFLTTIGTDATINPSAGIAGAVVSFVCLQIAAKLSAVKVQATAEREALERSPTRVTSVTVHRDPADEIRALNELDALLKPDLARSTAG